MTRKAAVVIGVDKTGSLTPLKSAAVGADEVAQWLTGEGYDVKCLTDKAGKVKAEDVEKAIFSFVTLPARYDMLVVYFSGHGYWQAQSDLWLLSGAPVSTKEAINLAGAMALAGYSGIPNVVFISDACRNVPKGRTGVWISGIDAFPNYAQNKSKKTKVDYFKATSEAQSAWEGTISGQNHSVLTYAIRSAFESPEPGMVKRVDDGGTLVTVVPNRKLEDYLQNKVDDILANIDINLTQEIEANVPSGDETYIAKIKSIGQPLSGSGTSGNVGDPPTTGRDAAETIARTLAGPDNELQNASNPETEIALNARLPSDDTDHFESSTGFRISGARVVKAVTTHDNTSVGIDLREEGDGEEKAALVRLWDVDPVASVAIELQDGRCAVLAGLNGYIGHAVFDASGLSGVSYVPSTNHWRWGQYEDKKKWIDRLRALVNLAVEKRTFQIRSKGEAEQLGDTIRMGKSIDPTLGLYAAHAFLQAGKDSQISSVMHYMRNDLGTDLYDVRTFASRRGDDMLTGSPVVPFCPMLTQTWNILRPIGITPPPALKAAMPYLCDSLWTTFHPEGAKYIFNAIEKGELP